MAADYTDFLDCLLSVARLRMSNVFYLLFYIFYLNEEQDMKKMVYRVMRGTRGGRGFLWVRYGERGRWWWLARRYRGLCGGDGYYRGADGRGREETG
jgi:hypothetical protein